MIRKFKAIINLKIEIIAKGIIKLEGTIGDVFYKTKDNFAGSRKGSIDAKQNQE
jgi:hypothetical protein